MLFEILIFLPDDILLIIWNYISPKVKLLLNKEYYSQFNYIIHEKIFTNNSYIRDIIRKDFAFVFFYILQRHFSTWISNSPYHYQRVIYPNYIHFLLFYSQYNNSIKCNNLIKLQLELSGLKKKWHKNTRIKYNKWSN